MKLLLLSLTFAAFTSIYVGAQSCTPGTNFADSSYGIWPSPTTNFPAAVINAPYTTDINFKVPSTVTDDIVAVVPAAILALGSDIQSFKIISVVGLPAGFLYACNISSCEYPGGANGCANIYAHQMNQLVLIQFQLKLRQQ